MKNDAYFHGYDDAKYGFTYVSDDAVSYGEGYKAFLDEQKKTKVQIPENWLCLVVCPFYAAASNT